MIVNRRTAIKQFLYLSGGVVLIPSCMLKDRSKTSIQLNHLELNGEDEQLLAELSETLIPKTDTPGAKDTYTHLYVMKMVDDCRTKKDQDAFVHGLASFAEQAKKKSGKSFVQMAPEQRADWLRQVEEKKNVPEETIVFYNMLKELAIQGFLTSQYYLTNVQVYELVPGRFHGCVPVAAANMKQ